jgi:ketosteroid isomerase-like protein
MSEAANTTLVQGLYAAFGRGDIQSILTALADDVDWVVPGPPGRAPSFGSWRGRESVLKFFQTLGASYEFETFLVRKLIAQGDTVVALGADHGRNKANGKRYQTDFVHVWTIADGRVTAFREYLDTLAVAAAFG